MEDKDSENNTSEDSENNTSEEVHTFMTVKANPLRLEPLYVKYYLIYLNFIIHGLIPFIMLIILNIKMYIKVGRQDNGSPIPMML